MTNEIKDLMAKNLVFKNLCKDNNNDNLFQKLKPFQGRLKSLLNFSKERYYSRLANRLWNVEINSKTYW